MAKIARRRIIEYEEDIPDTLLKFLKWQFTSGPTTGDDFAVFARLFKKEIEAQLKNRDAELVNFSKGHYDLSGFIRGGPGLFRYQSDSPDHTWRETPISEYVYFSISDVRHFPNDWYSNILIRTAKDDRDYTGGPNHYTSLKHFGQNVMGLFYRR